ncbi:hypothetical protein D3C77_186950 [compost metagenome]
MRVWGLCSRICLMQSAKCWAPPSRRSSRSTEVMTTYFSPISLMVSASFFGSSGSSASGRPWATSQKGQRRVQMAPMIMKVAVPWLKHSARLGQEASSQTECSLFLRRVLLMCSIFWLDGGSLIRIQSGLRSTSSLGSGMNFTGIRAILSPSRSLTPGSIRTGLLMIHSRCLLLSD